MGSMTRSILTLGSYDKEKESLEIPNVLRQSMQLIAAFPMLAVYAYHAYCHYEKNEKDRFNRPMLHSRFCRNLRRDHSCYCKSTRNDSYEIRKEQSQRDRFAQKRIRPGLYCHC